jgi:alpha-1,6-mannosyltransferase
LGVGWIGALGVPATVNTPLSLSTVVGGWLDLLVRLVGLDVPDGWFLGAVRLIAQVGIVVVAARAALTAPTGQPVRAVHAVAVVVGATVLLSPVVHLWYFLWVLPFLGAARLPRLASTSLVTVSVVAGMVAPLDSSLHGAYVAIVVGSMLAAAATLLLLVTPGARERLHRIASPAWTSSIDATVADHG